MFRWLMAVCLDWAIIVAACVAGVYLDNWLAWLAAIVVIGNRQHALGILGHEGTHRLIVRGWPRLNDWLSAIFTFWPLGVGTKAYALFHLRHHRELGTNQDPERLHLRVWSSEQFGLPMSRGRIAGQFVADLLGLGGLEVIKAIKLVGKASLADIVGPFAWWAIAGGILLYFGLWPIIIVWFLALFTTFWAFFRLRILTEHIGTDYVHTIAPTWWQRAAFLPHNTWLHREHHDRPWIPFPLLPSMRKPEHETVTVGELFQSYGEAA